MDADKQTIDFVLPWVDGNDKVWLAEKCKYQQSETNLSCDSESYSDCRFRDIGLLKYWFRSVERFAPWVNRVFFVTCGQKPDWLNESHPKLRLVHHRDYIPAEYLPTFQSNTIELNLHRIADLSEHFVLFNDDTFLMQPVKPEFFFKKGLPVLPCDLGIPDWLGNSIASRVVINNCGVLKRGLDVNRLIRKNIWKFVDVGELGFVRAAKNFVSFSVNRCFIPGTFGHLPQSHLKSTFDEIWHKVPVFMDISSRSRFRNDSSVNQWLACAWNMVSGRFYPANEQKRGIFISIDTDDLDKKCDMIRKQMFPLIAVNDRKIIPELEQCFLETAKAFDQVLSEKSSFEK